MAALWRCAFLVLVARGALVIRHPVADQVCEGDGVLVVFETDAAPNAEVCAALDGDVTPENVICAPLRDYARRSEDPRGYVLRVRDLAPGRRRCEMRVGGERAAVDFVAAPPGVAPVDVLRWRASDAEAADGAARGAMFDAVYAQGLWGDKDAGHGVDQARDAALLAAAFDEVVDRFAIKTLVDLPCGDLSFIETTAAFASLERYVGLDVSPRIVARAAARAPPNAVFAVADALDPAAIPRGFDAVLCRHLMIHMSVAMNLAALANIEAAGPRYALISTTLAGGGDAATLRSSARTTTSTSSRGPTACGRRGACTGRAAGPSTWACGTSATGPFATSATGVRGAPVARGRRRRRPTRRGWRRRRRRAPRERPASWPRRSRSGSSRWRR